MNPTKSPELRDLNDGTGWWCIKVDGHVSYCGTEKECRRQFAILSQPVNRHMQP
jgi:hypothetical protein